MAWLEADRARRGGPRGRGGISGPALVKERPHQGAAQGPAHPGPVDRRAGVEHGVGREAEEARGGDAVDEDGASLAEPSEGLRVGGLDCHGRHHPLTR